MTTPITLNYTKKEILLNYTKKEELVKKLYKIPQKTLDKLPFFLVMKMKGKVDSYIEEKLLTENVNKNTEFTEVDDWLELCKKNTGIKDEIEKYNTELNDLIGKSDSDCNCSSDSDSDSDSENCICVCDELNEKEKELEILKEKEVELDKKVDELVDEGFQLDKESKRLEKQRDELKKIVDVFKAVEDKREEKKQSKEQSKEWKKKEAKERAKELVKCNECDMKIRRDGFMRHLKSKAHLKNIGK